MCGLIEFCRFIRFTSFYRKSVFNCLKFEQRSQTVVQIYRGKGRNLHLNNS